MPLNEAAAALPSIAVVVNRQGGAAAKAGTALADQIVAAFEAQGRRAEVRLLDGCDIADAVTALSGKTLIVAAGGDGTLACAAGAILKSKGQAAMGILPLGTRNHLARDLGIPLDLAGAVATIIAGHQRVIDMGRANDLLFVNNASIGIYPQLVRLRDSIQTKYGVPKWAAAGIGAWRALRGIRSHRMRIDLDGRTETIRSPLLFVGNNVYSLATGRLGRRNSLEEGQLSLFAVASRSAAGTVAVAIRTMIGHSDLDRDFSAAGLGARLTVSDGHPSMAVALDGELHRLDAPLIFETVPAALTVMAPPAEDQPAAAPQRDDASDRPHGSGEEAPVEP